jgi:hypothetical protein
MGLLLQGFVPPARDTLGYTDKTRWELNNNEPRDPWQQGVYLPVITINGDAVYTFATRATVAAAVRSLRSVANTATGCANIRMKSRSSGSSRAHTSIPIAASGW